MCEVVEPSIMAAPPWSCKAIVCRRDQIKYENNIKLLGY